MELIDKWDVVNKLIQLENNYQFYKEKWDADVLYRRICELEIGIGKMPGVTDNNVGSKWIPVTERLPEPGVYVLCWYEYFRFGSYNRMYRTYGLGYYFRDGMWGGEVSNGHQTKVLAWMPLPEPPKEVE